MSRHVSSCHFKSCHVTSWHIMSRHATLFHVMSHNVSPCPVMSRHVMSYHATSYHVTSRHATSCHVLSHHVTYVGCLEGCRYHTASAVYNLVHIVLHANYIRTTMSLEIQPSAESVWTNETGFFWQFNNGNQFVQLKNGSIEIEKCRFTFWWNHLSGTAVHFVWYITSVQNCA